MSDLGLCAVYNVCALPYLKYQALILLKRESMIIILLFMEKVRASTVVSRPIASSTQVTARQVASSLQFYLSEKDYFLYFYPTVLYPVRFW